MRLPGTCSRYSKKAIPQLTRAATYHGRAARLRRCAYQAKVMNTLEPNSNAVAAITGLMGAPRQWFSAGHLQTAQLRERFGVALVHDTVPAARARRLDVVGAVVDEQRGRGHECKTALGGAVDVGVRLHDPGEV